MKVQDGRLVLPDGMNYRLLVLPDRETISPAVLRRIGELVEAGATVVRPQAAALEQPAADIPDCDREVRELAARIWGACDGETGEVRMLMAKAGCSGTCPWTRCSSEHGRRAGFHRRKTSTTRIATSITSTARRQTRISTSFPTARMEHKIGALPFPRRGRADSELLECGGRQRETVPCL